MFPVHIAIHMSTLQLMATAIGFTVPDRLGSSVLTTVAVLVSGVVSGVPLNFADLKKIPGVRLLSTLSPTRPLMVSLLQNDYAHNTLSSLGLSLVCRKQVSTRCQMKKTLSSLVFSLGRHSVLSSINSFFLIAAFIP